MRIVESRTRSCARAAAFCLIAASVAGCSADATRFRDASLSSPSARPAADVTGSVPAGRVDAQPLPPPPTRPMISSTGPSGGYRPAPPTHVAANTLHVPTREAHPHPAPNGGIHVVAPGENLNSIGRLYGKTRIEIAKANHLPVDAKLRVGQRVTIPGVVAAKTPVKPPVKTAALQPTQPPAKPVVAAKPAPAPTQATKPPPATKVVTAESIPAAHVVTPTNETADAATETTGNSPTFRWPVRGRVIGAFGAKINGQQNDGINLSVPEGTSVKAAEDGVVAYSGNELKGYGNLVLVRHAGGFVTAYAHASEVMVKRGDHVKRGQIIAKAGQTGGVTSPQLHFEIRKGSAPVDPTQYLNGG
jgi:murein DD-endopeptidase MepM/ murein hydrolase activator NlpD